MVPKKNSLKTYNTGGDNNINTHNYSTERRRHLQLTSSTGIVYSATDSIVGMEQDKLAG